MLCNPVRTEGVKKSHGWEAEREMITPRAVREGPVQNTLGSP